MMNDARESGALPFTSQSVLAMLRNGEDPSVLRSTLLSGVSGQDREIVEAFLDGVLMEARMVVEQERTARGGATAQEELQQRAQVARDMAQEVKAQSKAAEQATAQETSAGEKPALDFSVLDQFQPLYVGGMSGFIGGYMAVGALDSSLDYSLEDDVEVNFSDDGMTFSFAPQYPSQESVVQPTSLDLNQDAPYGTLTSSAQPSISVGDAPSFMSYSAGTSAGLTFQIMGEQQVRAQRDANTKINVNEVTRDMGAVAASSQSSELLQSTSWAATTSYGCSTGYGGGRY